MMTDTDNLSRTFQSWREVKLEEFRECKNAESLSQQQHLDENTLLRLAGSGGLAQATSIELEHLDNCPLCLSRWTAWCRALSAADECCKSDFADNLNNEFSHQAFGYLEAAASAMPKSQALALESSCGTYRLEILPDRQENNAGMIILSRLRGNTAANVTVRDRTGHIIISGSLKNGRLVRIHKNLDKLDLSIWTVG